MIPQANPRSLETAERSGRFGAVLWITAIQFFIVQVIVQAAWTTPFSFITNFISDLGNTACAPYPPDSTSYVCSPRHALMNASFVFLGVTRIFGAVLIRRAVPGGRLRNIGLGLITLSGLGVILVGLFPENVNIGWHRIGAGLDLVGGNLGIALLGASIWETDRRSWLGAYSIVSGVVGLVALWLFVSDRDLGLGIGGIERLTAYPIPIWMIVAGLVFLLPLRGPSTDTSSRA